MQKGLASSHAYFTRTGSWSIRPFANGRMVDIPRNVGSAIDEHPSLKDFDDLREYMLRDHGMVPKQYELNGRTIVTWRPKKGTPPKKSKPVNKRKAREAALRARNMAELAAWREKNVLGGGLFSVPIPAV